MSTPSHYLVANREAGGGRAPLGEIVTTGARADRELLLDSVVEQNTFRTPIRKLDVPYFYPHDFPPALGGVNENDRAIYSIDERRELLAKKFTAYDNELRNAQIAYTYLVKANGDAASQASSRIDSLLNELSRLNDEKADLMQQISTLRIELKDFHERARRQQEQTQNILEEIKQREAEVRDLLDQIKLRDTARMNDRQKFKEVFALFGSILPAEVFERGMTMLDEPDETAVMCTSPRRHT
ncbi:MAG TPA: hypothetical protein VEF04_19035 [Blastocatellia bacterium]|nr:hypothetical protein [Blastocatellia bacterium]